MNTHPADSCPDGVASVDVHRPFRSWMTGSLAVVIAGSLPARDASAAEPDRRLRFLRHSPFGVVETVRRIQAEARLQGMSIFAMMPGVRPVLVLASSVGGTPIVMDRADSQPAMPLSVTVCEGETDGADVLVASTEEDDDPRLWDELPAAVADDLHALPSVVDRALR